MRELSDQSGRARHYVLRTAFATVLLLLGFLFLRDLLVAGGNQGSFASLGNGPALFHRVVGLEAFAILLFLPAMTCGAIAGEKERNTLSILLTTRLGPATIVLEKLLSRLVLIWTLLLLSLPLLAFAYALGGLALDNMIRGILCLVAISVVVATLSLMCSAWCGSTVSAFFMTYAVGIGLYVGGFGYFLPLYISLYLFGGVFPAPRILILGMLLPSLVFFLITVRCLVRRAAVAPRNFVLSFFRSLDRLYNRMNVVVGNVVLTRETATLPDDRPIAWRETAKKSLGTVRYLVRVLVSIELPTVFLLVLSSDTRNALGMRAGVGSMLWFVVWCVSAALISVMCGSIVSGERTRQTLPVLLTTPIPGDQIVKQLFAGVRRLIFVLWIPFATIAGFDYWFHVGRQYTTTRLAQVWLLCDVLQVVIYPFLIAWVTFYLGARIRSPLWAIVASLMTVTGAVVVPYLLMWFAAPFVSVTAGSDWPLYVALISPATIVVVNEFGEARFLMTCVNFAFYGILLFGARRLCLRHADRLLGRAERGRKAPFAETETPACEEMVTA
jgi:ABC-type transport system involved in multi-copper enzyme maturation permease subunit